MTRTIYFVGAGAIAHRHAEALEHLPRGDRPEIAAADPNGETLESFSEVVPDARLYDSSEAMLEEPVHPDDFVIVCAPPFVHHSETLAALESGRHVLCEKPLAVTQPEAVDMVETAKANDRLLGACTCRHYGTPGTRHVTELIADGAIGDPYHVTWVHRSQRGRPGIEYQPASKWFLDRSKSGGGIVMDWGPYDFAALYDLLSPDVVAVRDAWTAQPETGVDPTDLTFDIETHGGASLVYRTGNDEVNVTYERASGTHGKERWVAEIEGTRGSIRWDWTDVDEAEVTLSSDDDGTVTEESTTVSGTEPFGPHQRPLVFFDRRIRGEDAPILTNEDALFTFSTIQAIYDCAASGEPQEVRPHALE